MTRSHERGDLPQLSENLAVGLGRIAGSMVLRVPYGYVQPGANVIISGKTVERLEGLGLVRPHRECGRKTMEPTPLGLRTLAAHEGTMKHDQEGTGRRYPGNAAGTASSSGQSGPSHGYGAILEPLGAMTGGLRVRCQVIWTRLACIHAGLSRPSHRSRSVSPPDKGAGMMTTRPASCLRLRKSRWKTS